MINKSDILYLNLVTPFCRASSVYQVSLVEPWFVFWRDVDEPTYPWREQNEPK